MLFAPDPRPVGALLLSPDPLPDPPILEVVPGCGPSADDVGRDILLTIRGYNMPPNSRMSIVFDADSEFSQRAPAVTVDPYGYFEATLPFFQSSSSFFAIEAYQAFDFDDVELVIASTQFTAPCRPEISAVTPTCDAAAEPNDPARKLEIDVRGTGWTSRLPVQVYLQAPDGAIVGQPVDGIVDPRRSFGVTLNVPALAAGEYQIVAVQGNDNFDIVRFPVPCPAPEVHFTPPSCLDTSGAPPPTWLLSFGGTDFRPTEFERTAGFIQFIFDAEGSPQMFFIGQGLPDPGSFELAIDPYQRPEGRYVFIARQIDIRGDIIREATTVFEVPCRPPEVFIDAPGCGPPQLVGDEPQRYDITIRGANFDPGTVTITFDADGQTGLDPDLFFATALTDGAFVQDIDPLARPSGTYRIDIVQDRRAGPITLSLFFSVPCEPAVATLEADPTCDRQAVGEAEAYSIELTGTGFITGPVELTFDADGAPEGDTATADDEGEFEHTLVASGRALGTYRIQARQQDQVGVVAEANVLFIVSCDSAFLRIVPESGSPGFVTMAEGQNFPAGATIILSWDRGIRSGLGFEVQVDSTGTFRRQVLIFHHDFLGSREMTAALPDDPSAFPDVSATFLVVPGRGSPPAFVIDGAEGPIVIRR